MWRCNEINSFPERKRKIPNLLFSFPQASHSIRAQAFDCCLGNHIHLRVDLFACDAHRQQTVCRGGNWNAEYACKRFAHFLFTHASIIINLVERDLVRAASLHSMYYYFMLYLHYINNALRAHPSFRISFASFSTTHPSSCTIVVPATITWSIRFDQVFFSNLYSLPLILLPSPSLSPSLEIHGAMCGMPRMWISDCDRHNVTCFSDPYDVDTGLSR